ncbi:MAG: cryptochrome/photolyase family protein [Azospirillum sp.]|nr:cryptochrome/photolyase family protein [Azospirillum sp.]
MPGALRFVLGDQLSPSLASLRGLDRARDTVLMVEVAAEATYVKHHKQKIAFLFSAMRHFAEGLRADGVRVAYVKLDDPANTHSFAGELARAVARMRPERVVVVEPGEWRVEQDMRGWEAALGIPVEIRLDDRFLCARTAFAEWAQGRKQYRMELFYREMRRKTGYLMDGDAPVGGAWNFDAENRKRLPARYKPPPRRRFAPDAITREVMALVAERFADHFGDLEPFGWAVTRADALLALEDFVRDHLPSFGDYQDAMKAGEDFLHHSLIAPYLNAGLLLAREVCDAAEAAYRAGAAPLNAVEGFVRQILGWREFVRGLYWARMPAYAATNHLDARAPLPDFYWTGDTKLACVREAVGTTRRNAYAHHIQRLMVLGNFALLAGVEPARLEEWFLLVYADAYEWVELPNVHGMALHADGGVLGSKPYAASGAYIDRMSDYCTGCAYDPKLKAGPKACPFNYLYWDFLDRNAGKLAANPRMGMPYRTLEAMTPARRAEIKADSAAFLAGLRDGAVGAPGRT